MEGLLIQDCETWPSFSRSTPRECLDNLTLSSLRSAHHPLARTLRHRLQSHSGPIASSCRDGKIVASILIGDPPWHQAVRQRPALRWARVQPGSIGNELRVKCERDTIGPCLRTFDNDSVPPELPPYVPLGVDTLGKPCFISYHSDRPSSTPRSYLQHPPRSILASACCHYAERQPLHGRNRFPQYAPSRDCLLGMCLAAAISCFDTCESTLTVLRMQTSAYGTLISK
jgi:hypothetical protein